MSKFLSFYFYDATEKDVDKLKQEIDTIRNAGFLKDYKVSIDCRDVVR
jgi:hypothetical protein